MCVGIKWLLCQQAVKSDSKIATLTAHPRCMVKSSKGESEILGEYYSKLETPTANERFVPQFSNEINTWAA